MVGVTVNLGGVELCTAAKQQLPGGSTRHVAENRRKLREKILLMKSGSLFEVSSSRSEVSSALVEGCSKDSLDDMVNAEEDL